MSIIENAVNLHTLSRVSQYTTHLHTLNSNSLHGGMTNAKN